MVDLAAGTEVYFTDQGWVDGAWQANGETHFLYTAPAGGLTAGTVVHFETGTPVTVSGGGGTVVKLAGTISPELNLLAGDQFLAYTSSSGAAPAAPVFLGGVHGDYNWGTALDPRYNAITTWDTGTTTATSDSHQPLGLTNAHTAVSLFPNPQHQDGVTPNLSYYGEKDNARYKLTAPTSGTRTQLLFALNNPANWDSDDATPYASGATIPSLTILPDPASGVLPLGAPRTSLRAGALTLPSYLVPAGENRLLVVAASNSGSLDITAVTFGGTAMAQVVEQNDTAAVDSLWVLALGTSASATSGDVVVTHAGAGDVQFIGAMAFARVDQTTPTSGALQFAGSGSPRSLTVNSASGDLVLDVIDLFAPSAAPTIAPVETRGLTHYGRSALGTGQATYAMSMRPGAASVPMGWTHDGTAVIHLAVNLRQASSASSPTVTTPTKASITHNSATLGGNVTADGGAALSERGVVYSMTSINSNPEIGGIGVTKAVASGTTTGVFTAAVSGLVFSTGYTYKAYATNSAGTSYSSADSLTTAPAPVAVVNLNRANATPSNAATVNWTLTLASAVTGMTAANFELTGAAAAGASVGTPTTANAGLTWTVPVTTGGTDGELTLRLANATGLSVAVNGLPYTGQSYTMDKTPPQVQSVVRQVPAGQTTSATSLVFRVTYTEAVTGVGTGRFALQAVNGGTVTGTVTGVTPVSASVYDVAVSLTGGNGEFRLRVLD